MLVQCSLKSVVFNAAMRIVGANLLPWQVARSA